MRWNEVEAGRGGACVTGREGIGGTKTGDESVSVSAVDMNGGNGGTTGNGPSNPVQSTSSGGCREQATTCVDPGWAPSQDDWSFMAVSHLVTPLSTHRLRTGLLW